MAPAAKQLHMAPSLMTHDFKTIIAIHLDSGFEVLGVGLGIRVQDFGLGLRSRVIELHVRVHTPNKRLDRKRTWILISTPPSYTIY